MGYVAIGGAGFAIKLTLISRSTIEADFIFADLAREEGDDCLGVCLQPFLSGVS